MWIKTCTGCENGCQIRSTGSAQGRSSCGSAQDYSSPDTDSRYSTRPRAIPPVPVQPWKTEPAPEPAAQKSKKTPGILVAAIATVVVVAGGILIFGKDNEPSVSAAPTTPVETTVYDASEDADEVYNFSEDLDEEDSTASVNTSVTYDDEEEDEDEDVAPVSTTSSASYDDEEDEDEDDSYIAPAPAASKSSASKTTVTSSSSDDEEWPEE